MATERSHRVRMMENLFAVIFHPIFFILVGNKDMNESSKEFEDRQDLITDCRVSCP